MLVKSDDANVAASRSLICQTQREIGENRRSRWRKQFDQGEAEKGDEVPWEDVRSPIEPTIISNRANVPVFECCGS